MSGRCYANTSCQHAPLEDRSPFLARTQSILTTQFLHGDCEVLSNLHHFYCFINFEPGFLKIHTLSYIHIWVLQEKLFGPKNKQTHQVPCIDYQDHYQFQRRMSVILGPGSLRPTSESPMPFEQLDLEDLLLLQPLVAAVSGSPSRQRGVQCRPADKRGQ